MCMGFQNPVLIAERHSCYRLRPSPDPSAISLGEDARRITIDEVAKRTGYSKYHFCSRFKSLTGMTYLNYLNSVRVSYACQLLQQGESVQAVCRATGFENVSYFIQMFKKIQHVTPYQYACQHRSEPTGSDQ